MLILITLVTMLPGRIYADEASDNETWKKAEFNKSGKFSVQFSDEECYDDKVGIKTNYIQFQASDNGYVTVKIMSTSDDSAYSFGHMTFCNEDMNVLGQKNEYWSTKKASDARFYTRTYGVKAGQNYGIKFESRYGIKISVTFKSVGIGNNTEKSKAKTLAAKKTIKGVIAAGENKTYWYKIKLKKSKTLKLTYNVKTNGDSTKNGLKITFCKANGKKFSDKSYDKLSVIGSSGWMAFYRDNLSTGTPIGIEAGTYYVKVQCINPKSSGYYSLKYQLY